jgi:hypothetical protein
LQNKAKNLDCGIHFFRRECSKSFHHAQLEVVGKGHSATAFHRKF